MKVRKFQSVWDAIESRPEAAAHIRLRSDLMSSLRERVESWNTTQARAAKRLHVTQPRLNNLLRGRIDRFSLDALVEIAEHAGLEVRIRIRAAA